MKNLKKISHYLIASVLSSSVYGAETNWGDLIKNINSIQVETVKATNSDITFDVAILPSGKVRLIRLNQAYIPEQAVLMIDSKESDLKKTCQESILYRNPFKASLLINKGGPAQGFNFQLSNGEQLNSEMFENPYRVINNSVEIMAGSKFPWTPLARYEKGPEAELLSLINNAMKSETGSIDLSDHNGVACDIASGHVKLSFASSVIHEKGLPKKTAWINQYQFAEFYRGFWADRNKFKSQLSASELRTNELILLGWNLSEVKFDKTTLYESANRLGSLFSALKQDVSGVKDSERPNIDIAKLEVNWKRTFEYTVPPLKELNTERDVETFNGIPVIIFRGDQ
jgi:hypothetical protein